MSTAYSVYPMVSALRASSVIPFVGTLGIWTPSNDDEVKFALQEYFLSKYITSELVQEPGAIPELECETSVGTPDPVNDFFARKRMSLRLRQQPGTGRFAPLYTGSVLDMLDQWIAPGEESVLRHVDRKQTFPSAKITRGCDFFASRSHGELIARLSTRKGDYVYLSPGQERQGFELFEFAHALTQDISPNREFTGVEFPMVDLDLRVDISFMEGMRSPCKNRTTAQIAEAIKQVTLKMNHVGFRAKAAVGLGMTKELAMMGSIFAINQPFYVVITRPSLSSPLFAFHVSEEVWKNPGNLD